MLWTYGTFEFYVEFTRDDLIYIDSYNKFKTNTRKAKVNKQTKNKYQVIRAYDSHTSGANQ